MPDIYYLGPAGTYSHKAAQKAGQHILESHLCPCSTFADIHQALKDAPSAMAVLPVENSSTTNIHENIEFLFDYPVLILAEVFLPITLNFIGFPEARHKIKYVHSHPKALQQASLFLQQHHFIPVPAPSTAQAQTELLTLGAEHGALGDCILNDKLVILQNNVGNIINNQTRFLVVSLRHPPLTQGNKITFVCKIKHQKGALLTLLQQLADNHINLTKIESKLIPQSPFEYLFLIEGLTEKPLQKETFEQLLSEQTLYYRLLGAYTCL